MLEFFHPTLVKAMQNIMFRLRFLDAQVLEKYHTTLVKAMQVLLLLATSLQRLFYAAAQVLEYSHSSRQLLGIQVDAAINKGSWGGPVFDRRGRCIGTSMAIDIFSLPHSAICAGQNVNCSP